jgi:2-polyprenyl-6-methoxyphenol hydroxylase-like FAD-dependent oxidoreductase
VETKFLVGCDGAHSTIRRGLKFEMEGKTRTEVFLMGDVIIDCKEPWFDSSLPSMARVFLHPVYGLLVLLPLPHRATFRVIMNVVDEEELAHFGQETAVPVGVDKNRGPLAETPFKLQEFEQVAQRRMPGKLTFTTATWLTHFKVNQRMSSGYFDEVSQNVAIMGDAAHVHSPVLGLGKQEFSNSFFDFSVRSHNSS